MCIFCGLGFYPWLALSRCDNTNDTFCEEHKAGTSEVSKAIEILKERFAKGEITREQFLDMRKTIE